MISGALDKDAPSKVRRRSGLAPGHAPLSHALRA
jgi:hypothetical protein